MMIAEREDGYWGIAEVVDFHISKARHGAPGTRLSQRVVLLFAKQNANLEQRCQT
jgi:hypothetical protein